MIPSQNNGDVWNHISGAHGVLNLLGRWPSFHDAHLERLFFDAGDTARGGCTGPSIGLELLVFLFPSQAGPAGEFRAETSVVISLHCENTGDVAIEGLNYDNCLYFLTIEPEVDGRVRVTLDTSSNLDRMRATFTCSLVSLSKAEVVDDAS